MSGREDTGSNDVAGAAAFERWRARNYGGPDDDTPMRYSGRPRLTGCRCHSRSEEPCEWCSRTEDEPPTTRPARKPTETEVDLDPLPDSEWSDA